MKKYALGIVAAVVAIGLSSFSLTSKSNAVDYYFGNSGSRAVPNWDFISTTPPNPAAVCDTDPNDDCIGKSTSAPDGSGNPTGPVTVTSTGNYNP